MFKRYLPHVVLVLVTIVLTSIFQPFAHIATLAQGNCRAFPETGKQVCGRFLEYWQQSGGLAQQGLPLSNEFPEVSELNGQTYTVQYFERAVFEKHPENARPFDVLLSQLGTFQFKRKYPAGDPSGAQPPSVQPTPTQAPAATGKRFDLITSASYKTILDDLAVVGVFKYNGSEVMGSPEIVVTLTDNANNVLATTSAYTTPDLIKPGTVVPFRALVDSPPANYTKVTIDIDAEPPSQYSSAYADFVVEQATANPPARSSDSVKIAGRIKNTGTKTAQYVSLTVAIYDSNGQVVDVVDGYAQLDKIAPGATSPFQVESYQAKAAPKFDIVVTGSFVR